MNVKHRQGATRIKDRTRFIHDETTVKWFLFFFLPGSQTILQTSWFFCTPYLNNKAISSALYEIQKASWQTVKATSDNTEKQWYLVYVFELFPQLYAYEFKKADSWQTLVVKLETEARRRPPPKPCPSLRDSTSSQAESDTNICSLCVCW